MLEQANVIFPFFVQHAMCGNQLRAPDVGVLLRLLLLAPVLEELVVRAGLQQYLTGQFRQSGANATWLPVVISATVFSVLHVAAGWTMVAAIFVPGLLLAMLYQWTRDWRLCALMHAVFNGMALGVCMQ
ncbi:JDVT-CTERM system glutamic-type intramembrane protease MrtJ [Undibacterium sp. Ji49W]|uniref:JDVT-CTERM system glutamic-type intramembrane protease MrtJ n=1 Tax=Undibacterium sp. Ji49W TaxID=3413040 RepID=UPI003BF0950B